MNTTEEQLELGTIESQTEQSAESHWIEGVLLNSSDWLTAREISAAMFWKVSDRDIREAASASKYVISGQKGYKHVKHSTAEECAHAANWLESQAKKMSDRACAIRRTAHRIFNR